MDRVAKEGMVFTDAHSASSVCSPSRYALLTGRYPWRTRLQKSICYVNEGPLITADRLTLPKLLFGEGYHTAMVGKWHLGCNYVGEYKKGELPKSGPIANGRKILYGPFSKGFQYYYGAYTNGLEVQIENDREVFRVEKLEDIMPLHTRKAVEYIEQRAKTKNARRVPFFLHYAMVAPHTPLVPSVKYKGSTGLGDYADFLAETDGAVTAVLDALDRTGLAGETIVIFTTDNGTPESSERKLRGQKSSAHLRGYKGDAWDGGHRVPTFIRWPGVIKPGSTSNALVCQTDFLATFAELAGIHLPDNAGEDSVSLLSVLKGAPSGLRDTLVSHSFYGRFAFRQGPWKLQFSPGSGGWSRPRDINAAKNGLSPIQLYNLKTDPGEKNNLHAKYPGVVWHMTRKFEQQIESGSSTPGKPQSNEAAVDIRKTHMDYPGK
jgi:arylsulfatase A-like enzyme